MTATNINGPTPDFNHSVSGVISLCSAAGVPQPLLVPVMPARKGDRNTGKAPSNPYRPTQDGYAGLVGWRSGNIDPATLNAADRAGFNAGLLMGCATGMNGSAAQYFGIDLDLEPGHRTHLLRVVAALQAPFSGPSGMLVRQTVDYRGLVLVACADALVGSRKLTFKLKFKGDPIGKMELLAAGQQGVIAGQHYSGNSITWWSPTELGESYKVPPLITHPAAVFASFADICAALDAVWAELKGEGYEVDATVSGDGTHTFDGDDAARAPHWLTAEELIEYVDRMTPPAEIGRDEWVPLMMAIAASRRGVIARRGPLSDEQDARLTAAIQAMDERWPGYAASLIGENANPPDYATSKWEDDFRDEGKASSFGRLVDLDWELNLGANLNYEEGLHVFTFEARPNGEASNRKGADGAEKADRYSGFYTLAELEHRTFQPIKWIVPDLIVEGLTVLAGKPKIGKSWLTLAMGLAVAREGEVLGRKVTKRRVLYCGLEDNDRRMKWRTRQILGEASSGWPANFTTTHRLAAIDGGGLTLLEQWIGDYPDTGLIVIDIFSRVKGKKGRDEEPYQHDYRLVGALQQFAIAQRIAIILVHHTRKAVNSAEDVLDQISGTTGIAGAADTCIVLSEDTKGVRLYSRGRDIEMVDWLVEKDEDTGHWSILGDYEEPSPAAVEMGARILELFKAAVPPRAMAPKEVAAELGEAKINTVQRTMRRMAKANPPSLRRAGHGVYALA